MTLLALLACAPDAKDTDAAYTDTAGEDAGVGCAATAPEVEASPPVQLESDPDCLTQGEYPRYYEVERPVVLIGASNCDGVGGSGGLLAYDAETLTLLQSVHGELPKEFLGGPKVAVDGARGVVFGGGSYTYGVGGAKYFSLETGEQVAALVDDPPVDVTSMAGADGSFVVGARFDLGMRGALYVLDADMEGEVTRADSLAQHAGTGDLGDALANVGDLDGDGLADIVLSEADRSGVLTGEDLAIDGGIANLYVFNGGMYSSHGTDGLGDLDGDGYGEYAVGETPYDSEARRRVVLLSGLDPEPISTVYDDREFTDDFFDFGYPVVAVSGERTKLVIGAYADSGWGHPEAWVVEPPLCGRHSVEDIGTNVDLSAAGYIDSGFTAIPTGFLVYASETRSFFDQIGPFLFAATFE